jgi:ABC-type polysaccharide/polyol phosphate transport system ATPase subunit
MSVAIQVDRLSKQYRLGQIGGGRLVDDFNQWLAKLRGKENPLSTIRSITTTQRSPRSSSSAGKVVHPKAIWALKRVSFEVKQGEVLGIVGRNGSGKSTLLKVLSRVTAPTEGEARIRGRIASLLEVGTGFHPELTGRENIYINGAILGMNKSEIRGKFDEIVAFSEVDQFIDTPVKRYSSGMHVRLAFAVVAHLEPEILIVDEVLAVGDSAFQRKCLGKMKDVAREGRTILFVSHNTEAVRRLCDRGIWLHDGAVQMDGAIDDVLNAYSNRMPQQSQTVFRNLHLGLSVFDIRLKNQAGACCQLFRPGDDLTVEMSYQADHPIVLPYFAILVQSFKGSCFAANMLLDGSRPPELHGKGRVACTFKSIPLLPQDYTVQLAIRAKNGKDLIIGYEDVAYFKVSCSLADYGYKGEFMALAAQSTPVVVPYQWHLPDGTTTSVGLNPARG